MKQNDKQLGPVLNVVRVVKVKTNFLAKKKSRPSRSALFFLFLARKTSMKYGAAGNMHKCATINLAQKVR